MGSNPIADTGHDASHDAWAGARKRALPMRAAGMGSETMHAAAARALGWWRRWA